jgi:hypothetical protein
VTRKPKKLIRTKTHWSLKPLYVIAIEGAVTEEIYFKSIFRNKNIRMKILTTSSGDSSPDKVLKRLNQYRREYSAASNELWLVIDRDSWNQNTLNKVKKECKDKGYNFILSNPCFELWLLLHQANPKQPLTCANCETELKKLITGYTKSNYKSEIIKDNVNLAIDNAKTLGNENNIQNPPNTAVYKLVEELLKEETNN